MKRVYPFWFLEPIRWESDTGFRGWFFGDILKGICVLNVISKASFGNFVFVPDTLLCIIYLFQVKMHKIVAGTRH